MTRPPRRSSKGPAGPAPAPPLNPGTGTHPDPATDAPLTPPTHR
ncbi:hypothetical protein ACFZAM_05425 [Streptomyces sp. NPDC008079]